MEFPVRTGAPASQRTACAVLPVFDGRRLSGPAHEVDASCGGLIGQLIKSGDASTKLGSTLLVPRLQGTAAERALLVGCGKAQAFDGKAFNKAAAAAARALKDAGFREATSYLGYLPVKGLDTYRAARQSVELTRTALYRFDELKSKKQPKHKLNRLGIAVKERSKVRAARRGVNDGQAIATGMDLCRNLANRPANVCTPSHLAREARALARQYDNIQVKVLGERDMKRLGMGALLSVTQGAEEPARLIVIEYQGAGPRVAPVVICGKGITFDTGGISLKPPPKMDEMKFDMGGAASVLGTMATLGELQPPCNVVAVIPACENMPGHRATRPGDIVKSMSGQTIEILNTDAEGRLILCDALTYAKRFKPRYLLDVATLTGACVIALGNYCTGVFSNDDELAGKLLDSGERSFDPAWRLPVGVEYFESLESNFADFANSGAREGGASIAAAFLSKFVDDTPWAHLDIAGTAWLSGKSKGATGRPVALLADFLINLSASSSQAS